MSDKVLTPENATIPEMIDLATDLSKAISAYKTFGVDFGVFLKAVIDTWNLA